MSPPVQSDFFVRLRAAGRLLAQGLRSALGAPDYSAYLAHRRLHRHDGQPLLSEAEFFRERQRAKYARGASRCC